MLLVLLQKNNNVQLKKNQQQDVLEQQEPTSNKTASQKPVKEKNSMVVKGMTFYKAEEESYKANERGRAKNSKSGASLMIDIPTTITVT